MATARLSGAEQLHDGPAELQARVLDFWRWASSDLVGNTFRGWYAEFLVALALGIAERVREDWLAWDLNYSGLKVEVKSSAYIQGWAQKRLSVPRFSIRPARGWDPETNELTSDAERRSDVYVFCLLAHRDQATLDVLDVSQWEFYVLQTRQLAARVNQQASIGLSGLRALGAATTTWAGVRSAVDEARAV